MNSRDITSDARYLQWLTKKAAATMRDGDADKARLQAQVFTGLATPVARGLTGVTQFALKDLVVQCAPTLADLERVLAGLDSIKLDMALIGARETVSGFTIWTKAPVRASYRGLIRAWSKQERDVEDFLRYFREQLLGVLGPQLDAYIAAALLGLHVSRGQLLLEGDLYPARDLEHMPDAEIRATILKLARHGKRRAESGKEDHVLVHPPGPQVDTRFDSLRRAVSLEEVGELFAPSGQVETTMHAAMTEALMKNSLERAFRKVGLPREYARFAARVAAGRRTFGERPWVARAILRHRERLLEALHQEGL